MRTFFGRPYALLHTAFCLTFGATLATAAKAMPDSTDQARAVPLFVGHLNFDAIPDTVYGWADARQHYLPHSLHWGRVPSPGHAAPVTTILYPDWQDFSGTVAFQQMNADTVTDIIFYLWGKTGAPAHDTLRPLLLFGQPGLDSLSSIDLSSVPAFQVSPFVALEMRPGSELVDPALRDLSGKASYALAPVDVIVDPGQQPGKRMAPGEAPTAGGAGDPHARLYPNPTSAAARLEIASLAAGDYGVEIVSLGGAAVSRQTVRVPASGDLLGLLDVHALPVGYYTVRVDRGTAHIGDYPIIITR